MKPKHLLIPLFLFLGTLIIFKTLYPSPRNWYDHYLHLSKSFLSAKVDVPNLPPFYHDRIFINGKNFLPFPPMPAISLMPFVIINPQTTQQQVSIIFGSLNAFLIYFVLIKFTSKKKAIILSAFAVFGTSHFWSSLVGTTWFFAHIVAITFFLLALIAHFSKKDLLSAVLFSLAVLSRLPILPGVIFFLLQLKSEPLRLRRFIYGLLPLLPTILFYNWLRFGNIFQTGYLEIYKSYAGSYYPYTIIHQLWPDFPYFGHLDPRNIPLHLFTFLAMPPIIKKGLLAPSPYGMGTLFTSPLLFLALKPPFKTRLEKNLIIGSLAIAVVDFMHYMQGWVQFGYRFALDFLVFLIIILALRFKLNKKYIALLLISIVVNVWGVTQAIKLGW